jgi:hypothetical protein
LDDLSDKDLADFDSSLVSWITLLSFGSTFVLLKDFTDRLIFWQGLDMLSSLSGSLALVASSQDPSQFSY